MCLLIIVVIWVCYICCYRVFLLNLYVFKICFMLIYLLVFYLIFEYMLVWCDGVFVFVCVFVVDVMVLVVMLLLGGYVFNVCVDCYCFVVGLCVMLLVGKISLLLFM